MKLIQKLFELIAVDGEFNLKKEEGELTLVVNGYTTTIKFEDLFVGNVKRYKTGVKGHSILQSHKLEDGFLLDGNDNKYSLYFNGKNIKFKEVTEPTFFDKDIELEDDDYNRYLDILLNGIEQSKSQEKDDKVEDTNEEVNLPPEPESVAKDIEIEEIIEELEEQGYDHFGKGQYNAFLQHNKVPVLYVGKKKYEYTKTDYVEDSENGDKATLEFKSGIFTVCIGILSDRLIFPGTSEEANDVKEPVESEEEPTDKT